MSLLSLLQLASPALPIGAYSYSEGVEFLSNQGIIFDSDSLDHWLRQELKYGSIRIDSAVLVRTFQGVEMGDFSKIIFWNHWLSAQRESEELRCQSWQMGNALIKLFNDIGNVQEIPLEPCNYAIAFGMVSFYWEITLFDALSSFLFCWASNLVSAGIRSIPIGQTAGQRILFNLHTKIIETIPCILALQDDELESCNIGLVLASIGHETQYSRLFRS